MAKMGRNESVPLETLAKVCNALKCDLADIVEIKRKEEKNGYKRKKYMDINSIYFIRIGNRGTYRKVNK